MKFYTKKFYLDAQKIYETFYLILIQKMLIIFMFKFYFIVCFVEK